MRKKKINKKNKNKKEVNIKNLNWEIIFLVLILAFGLFLRIYQLSEAPFWIDESISANAANSILEKGLPVSDGEMNHKTYFLHYSMAFFMLFGETEFFARFVSVIFGLLTIFLAYKFGKEYSKSTALISALFFSVFYLSVFFSRQARYYQLLQLAFFACIYFLYKSKNNKNFLIPSIACFFIALDTQLQALVLAPFIILHILLFTRKQWFYCVFPIIPLFQRIFRVRGLTSGSAVATINYATKYLSYAGNMLYLLILFIPGAVVSYIKKKRLTLLILIPSLITLFGVFTLRTFAFRYSYFFVFPLLLFCAVLFGFLYDKYGKLILVPLFIIIFFTSNIIFPYTYVNILYPVSHQFYDSSAPYTDYKNLPLDLKQEMQEGLLVSYFSMDVKYYIKNPDYAVAFSMSGVNRDEISRNNTYGETVDRYSGAPILTFVPEKPYYLTADRFSVSKLFSEQKEFFEELTEDCEKVYSEIDLEIFYCE